MFALFYCLLDLRSGECNVVSLYVCVALSMELFVLCVACLVKHIAICLGVFVILLLNVMELLCGWRCLLDRPCMVFHRIRVLGLWSQ